jgi:mono/diheme cytochrome c family protein
MNRPSLTFAIASLLSLPTYALPPANDFTPQPQVPSRTPEEFLKTVQLPDGYSLELVLSEPQIKEPVTIAFDPNGAMYVAEMRTYMQDIDGKDGLTPRSVVSKHVSTKGDGNFDQHSVYLKDMLLPRMILPLDDRILLGITNTSDLTIYSDKNKDGIADDSKLWFKGGPRGGNMEHQPSGLVWGLDNWMYSTYNSYRLRWNGENSPPLQESTFPNGGQWGLAQDNHGQMWWSNAGGEKGLHTFQVPIIYGALNPSAQKEKDFDVTWPLVGARDYQGGPKKSRDDGTLNHFTGCGGQTVFRGDRLPPELIGNVFLPEPVGRLIRRAIVSQSEGITTLSNANPQSEFIRSTDLCFRPLNMTTGPDGCLYIVDMYRGIIQEGNWVREGSYLRNVVKQHGFQNVIGHGRIWRLTHKDFKPGPQPKMLAETPAQWVAHLAHPNGWWRDTAQRLLIVKGDQSVVPALTEMLASRSNPLARLHALWTLEGLGALTPELARSALKDADPALRVQAIRACETLIKAGDTTLIADIQSLATDENPQVKLQSAMTAKLHKFPQWEEQMSQQIAMSPLTGLRELGSNLLGKAPKINSDFTPPQRKQFERGMKIYQEVCFACHGADGKGTPIPGDAGKTLAPPLGNSHTVHDSKSLVRVLLHGLEGPINGKTYESMMIPQNTNSDEWLADISSYLRNAFGNRGSFIDAKAVTQLRKQHADRTKPWTIEELRTHSPQPLKNRQSWKLSSSHNQETLAQMIDGKQDTRWDSKTPQVPDIWIRIDLPTPTEICGIELQSTGSPSDSPQLYEVQASSDGTTWTTLSKGKGTPEITSITFQNTTIKHLRIQQQGSKPNKFWSIHELQLLAPPKSAN